MCEQLTWKQQMSANSAPLEPCSTSELTPLERIRSSRCLTNGRRARGTRCSAGSWCSTTWLVSWCRKSSASALASGPYSVRPSRTELSRLSSRLSGSSNICGTARTTAERADRQAQHLIPTGHRSSPLNQPNNHDQSCGVRVGRSW